MQSQSRRTAINTFSDSDEDELSSIKPQINPTKPNGSAPAQQAAPSPAKSYDIDWDTDKVKAGDGLMRAKPGKDETLRFAVIPGVKPVAAMTHFFKAPKTGVFQCLGEGCPACAKEESRWSVAVLVAVYTGANKQTGKLTSSSNPDIQIGYLGMSATVFEMLRSAPLEGSGVADHDFAMTYDGRRYNIKLLSPQTAYSKLKVDVVELAKPFVPKLQNKVGRIVSKTELRAMVASARTSSEDSNLSDVEEL